MARVEMIECDLAKCEKREPNPTAGFVTTNFDGRAFDFCSSAHAAKFEDELRSLDPAKAKPKRKAKR